MREGRLVGRPFTDDEAVSEKIPCPSFVSGKLPVPATNRHGRPGPPTVSGSVQFAMRF